MRRALTVLALAVACAAPPAAQTGVQVFSALDRGAVETGGAVTLTVEALATAPTAADRAALRDALGGLDVEAQVRPALRVVDAGGLEERMYGDVVQVRRRVVLSVADPSVAEVPALWVGGVGETRPHPLAAYASGAAAQRAAAHVVPVTAEGALGGAAFGRLGSAFLVGDDALVTAYHVVVGAERVRVWLPDGTETTAGAAWALDPARDLAVLRVDADAVRRAGLRPLPLAPSRVPGAVAFAVRRGDRAVAAARRFDDLASAGERVRLTANAVRPGDSGGPLLDEAGRVLGVVTSGRSVDGDPDLLASPVCLAADATPLLARLGAGRRAVPLARALASAGALAAGQVHAAVGAVGALPADGDAHLARLAAAVRRAPDRPALQYLAGTTLDEGGAPQASAALRAAHAAGFTPAGYSLGHRLLGAGRAAEAEAVFAEVGGPYAALAAFGRAQALVRLGRYAEAEPAVDAVLDRDPSFAPALYLLGLVRVAQGREAEATALAVRLRPRGQWADALRLAIRHPALRPPMLEPLPRIPAWSRPTLAAR